MKTKLLKQVRKRFKYKYLGELEWMFPIFRKYWEVIDYNGTKIQRLEHVSNMCYGDMIRIDSPSIAEQLVMEMKGVRFVYNHRCYRSKMKNKSFKRKYFAVL